MSHTIIDNVRLAMWCQRVIDTIKRTREEERRDIAKAIAEKRNRGWFHRLFKKPDFTTDSVYNEITRTRYGLFDHPWWLIFGTGGKSLEVAERLLVSCKVAERVTVSSDDIETLNKWSSSGVVEQIFATTGYR